ncbi:MAG TPA: hypothetical protein VGC45_15835 [Gryllotalpicola sp.]
MAIAYVASSAVEWTLQQSTTVPVPAGATAGDVALVMVATLASGTASSSTPPDGSWTELPSSPLTPAVFSSTLTRVQLWSHVITGHEPAAWVFAQTAPTTSNASQALAGVWRGVDADTPLDTTPTGAVGTTSAATGTATAPTLTTITDAATVAFLGWSWDGAATTPPAGFTERADDQSYLADRTVTPPAATGAVTHSAGNSAGAGKPWAAWLVALRPAGTGTAYTPTPADTGASSDHLAVSISGSIQVTLTDTSASTDTAQPQAIGYGHNDTDTGTSADTQLLQLELHRPGADTTSSADALAVTLTLGRPLADTAVSSDHLTVALQLQRAFADTAASADAVGAELTSPGEEDATGADDSSSADQLTIALALTRTAGDTATGVDHIQVNVTHPGDGRDITVTATLGPRRWAATLGPPRWRGHLT